MAKKEIVSRTEHRIRFIFTGRKRASHISNVASSHWLTSTPRWRPLTIITAKCLEESRHVTSLTWLGYLLHYFNSYQAFDCLSLDILKTTWGRGGVDPQGPEGQTG